MTTNWSGLWAPRRPPDRIIEDARRAFDARSGPGTRRVDLVFDSLTDAEWSSSAATRILMFSGEQLALLLTCTHHSDGSRVGGALFTREPRVTVTLRYPSRPPVAIPTTDDGRLLPTTVLTGPASVLACADAGPSWQSDWLTLS
jgi:hypothetical protein